MGATSDIIKKETYTFKDRSDNEITLRPEGTAPIVRLFINNKLQQSLPQKFSYMGPIGGCGLQSKLCNKVGQIRSRVLQTI